MEVKIIQPFLLHVDAIPWPRVGWISVESVEITGDLLAHAVKA